MRTSSCPACILGSRPFGRGKSYTIVADEAPSSWAGDLRLFATTFLAGFLFVSLYLA
ncbi:MAG TPA: hypothetical protein VNJ05_09010 [Sphingomicrobium sp.]|nr:hypothetical protein [Sphingomicrobium sp.]